MSLDMKVKKDFGGFVLELELHVENEVLALLGASGCGKSMTLKCVAGIVTPDEGYIRVNGKTLFDSEKNINLSPQKRHVGLLFQNYALFPNMTVKQNIMMGMKSEKLSKKEKEDRCEGMFKNFYLEGLEHHMPSQLSGGQQQRVALARIMVSRPQILMLDEPFSALDSFLRWELEQELMRVLEDFDGTALIVSHNRDEVYRISDHIAVISDGKINCIGDKEQIFTKPKTYQSALLTGCKNFSRAEYIDETHVLLSDWDVTLKVDKSPRNIRYIALRPGIKRLVDREYENTAKFKIIKEIDNLTEHILILSTDDAYKNEELNTFKTLNITIGKNEWLAFKDYKYVYLDLLKEDILLLTD